METLNDTSAAADRTEAAPLPKILVGICSCQPHHDKRQAIRETWLTARVPGIECRFFMGGPKELAEQELDMLALDCDDSYHHLPEKVLAFFAEALSQFDFDWLFKCDDDTYIALDRLHTLVSKNYELVGNSYVRDRGSPSGGAGYLITRRIVELLVADRTLETTGPEDIIIGEAAVKHGARTAACDWLRNESAPFPMDTNLIVTSHWCSPERMRAIHAIRHGNLSRRFRGVHSDWNDEVFFYDNGLFSRKTSCCAGKWETRSDGALLLRWFDWGDETLISCENGFHNQKLHLSDFPSECHDSRPRSLSDFPFLNLRKLASPKLLYFSPVGNQCLELVENCAEDFKMAGADVCLVAYEEIQSSNHKLEIGGPVRGGKWQLAKRFLRPCDVAQYDFIFVWDDDIRIKYFLPRDFASIMHLNQLDVAQPSIISPHGISHSITAPQKLPDLPLPKHQVVGRLTTFVEVMVPVFSRKAWLTFFPFISDSNRTGWGYDYFPFHRRGIVDHMIVEHTRAVSSIGDESRNDLATFLWQHALIYHHPESIGCLFGNIS